ADERERGGRNELAPLRPPQVREQQPQVPRAHGGGGGDRGDREPGADLPGHRMLEGEPRAPQNDGTDGAERALERPRRPAGTAVSPPLQHRRAPRQSRPSQEVEHPRRRRRPPTAALVQPEFLDPHHQRPPQELIHACAVKIIRIAASSSPTLRVGNSDMRPSTSPGRKPSTGMLCRMSSSGKRSRSAARDVAAAHPNPSANTYEIRSASTPRDSEYSVYLGSAAGLRSMRTACEN